jgi:hypothetical protein
MLDQILDGLAVQAALLALGLVAVGIVVGWAIGRARR